MHRAFTFLLICASIILAASSSFSETNDALATIPAMASTIAANIDGTKTQGSSAQAVAKPELPRTSNVAGCFCCPCQGEESYSGKSRKRARLSVGDSAVQIEWDVAFSFLTMAIVLCGIWRFCKFERSVRKEPPPIRIKLHFVLRALVDTLEKAVSEFEIDKEERSLNADFSLVWEGLLNDQETIKSLFGWPKASLPGEVLPEELPALARELESLFGQARFVFAGRTITEGLAAVLDQLKFYGNAVREINQSEARSVFSEKNVSEIERAVEKGRLALSLMEREIFIATK